MEREDDISDDFINPRSGKPLTIRGKIRAAKKVHVFLDPRYRATDSRQAPIIPLTVAQALKIVDMAPKDNPPTGVIDKDGILLLHPPA
ncbi:hypothetical protein G6L37_05370 [Agrobacterium rubi]|nr:hypothetical protein [Agrobacterium rubi]NTF24787.1 hypothetical protein [Agrobacterium rubi]